MRNILIALSIALILSAASAGDACALGIGPGRVELDFQPGLSQTLEYLILNNEQKDVTVEVYVGGDLSEYVSCSADTLHFSPQEVTKTFTCDLRLPDSIETPGVRDTRIGVVESMEAVSTEGATMGGRVGVESQLWVRVPYPGYYAEIGLSAPNTAIGEDVMFTLKVSNKGTEPFTASGTIKVFDAARELASLDAGQASLQPGESRELTASWPTEGRGAGEYRAIATVDYSGNIKEAEAMFRIGELRAEITGVPKVSVPLGDIAKFRVSVESVWNDPISGIYVDLDVTKSGKSVSSGKSETFSLAGWEKKEVLVYIDTADMAPGTYDVRATLNYMGIASTKDVHGGLEVTSFTLDTFTLLVLVIIILLGLAVLVYFRRRKVRRK